MPSYSETQTAHHVDPAPRYYSRAGAAALLDCSTRSIDRMIASGELKAVRIGVKLVRIPAASIAAIITDIEVAK